MVKAKIVSIVYNGWTFEVQAEIDSIPVTFYTTHPSEKELHYHCTKQWEMIERCKGVSDDYLKTFKELEGKEFELQVGGSSNG